jgi:hypothetical protein
MCVSGTVPLEFSQLAELGFLYLSSNGLTGSGVWDALPEATTDFDVSNNFFHGEIPFGAEGYSLVNLYTRNNSFSGTLPPSLPLLASIQILDMSFNDFTGTIPQGLQSVSIILPCAVLRIIIFQFSADPTQPVLCCL